MTSGLLPLTVLLAYLLGAIPFGFLVARWHGVDIREEGSGNIGATNVSRIIGRRWGILVFFLDFAKGAAPVLLARMLLTEPPGLSPHTLEVAAGIAAFLGHLFPIYLGFRGGKGVATGAGVVAVLLPGGAVAAFLLWAALLSSTRYVAVASLGASALLALWQPLLVASPLDQEHRVITLFCLVAAVLVFARHHSNIHNLAQGVEHRFRETSFMLLLGKLLHVLTVGLWFGSMVFFTIVGLLLFDAFDGLSRQPAAERPLWYPQPEVYAKAPPSPAFPDPLAREQGSRTAGYAVSPIFTWYYGLQTACGILACITALGWWLGRSGSRLDRVRALVLVAALAGVLIGWWLEVKVSDLRVPRNDLTDRVLTSSAPSEAEVAAAAEARKTFGRWHGYSLLLNMLTLLLVTIAMGLASQLPSAASSTSVPSQEDSADSEVEVRLPTTSGG